jgi:hypothetical protein
MIKAAVMAEVIRSIDRFPSVQHSIAISIGGELLTFEILLPTLLGGKEGQFVNFGVSAAGLAARN